MPGLPMPLLAGATVWSAAIVTALAAALVRGNEPVLIAGQLLGLGLLPFGVLAASTLHQRDAAAVLTVGFAGATAAACTMHILGLLVSLARRQTVLRLYLANDVAPVHVVMLGLLLAFAWAMTRAAGRSAAVAAMALIVVYIFGSGVRSLWVVAPATVVVFIVVSGALRLLVRPRVLLGIVALGVLPLAVAFGLKAWITTDRPTVLPGAAVRAAVLAGSG